MLDAKGVQVGESCELDGSAKYRQEGDNTRPFVFLTGEAYHHIVQIILKLVSNFLINGSRHARYLVCFSLDVM